MGTISSSCFFCVQNLGKSLFVSFSVGVHPILLPLLLVNFQFFHTYGHFCISGFIFLWTICSSCLRTLNFDINLMIRECRPPAERPTVHHSTFESTRSRSKFQFHPFVSASRPSLSCLRAFIQVSSATSSWLSWCFSERLHHCHLPSL